MSLKRTIFFLVIGVGIIVLAFSMVGINNLSLLGEQLTTSTSRAEQYAEALNLSRRAQVNFQRQVQEWKNVLIRGNDRALYDKYFDSFVAREIEVQKTLKVLSQVSGSLGHDIRDIQDLLRKHQALGEEYRKALKIFDATDPETGKKVDKLLRGIDRPASQAMDALADTIENEATARLTTARNEAEAFARERFLLFAVLATVAIVIVIGLSWHFGLRILRLIGAEPSELVKTFGEVARGDLTQKIALRESDESSLAAQAALMQMRVRTMVMSIKQGAAEFSAAAERADSGASQAVIQDALREAKKSITALNKAADRFKVQV